MVLPSIYNNPFSFGDFMSYPYFECYSQLQTLDALRAIFVSVLGGFMHGFKADSTTSGNLRWLAMVDDDRSPCVERLAKGITGDLLRAYAYEYVAEDVRKGSLPISRVNRISREMLQFNRYIVYQGDSLHCSQFPEFSHHQYPTSNPHVSIYVFDLVAIQELISYLIADGTDATDHIELIADFRKAGMKPVEKDGVAAAVRGKCALELVS